MRLGKMVRPPRGTSPCPGGHLDDPASLAKAKVGVRWGHSSTGAPVTVPADRSGRWPIRTRKPAPDGSRPNLALVVDPLVDIGVVDVGDIEMPPVTRARFARLEEAVAHRRLGLHPARPRW